jgi:hypothetical protein
VATGDIPVINIIDNPVTNNFDILYTLRLCCWWLFIDIFTQGVIYKIIDNYYSYNSNHIKCRADNIQFLFY